MSLTNFALNYVKDCPELLLSSEVNPNLNLSYSNLYGFYKQQERRYPIQSFMDLLFYDSICKCSQNTIEYEILKNKSRKIAQLSQSIFDLSISSMLNNSK